MLNGQHCSRRDYFGKQMQHGQDLAKQPVSAFSNLVPRLMTDPRVWQVSDAAIT